MDPDMVTKSGLMCGLGEDWDELVVAMQDLREQDVDILTLGQYLRPTGGHLPVVRFYSPEEFTQLHDIGLEMGYRHVESAPLVRSSYHAWEQVRRASQTR
jgi:lipoic acid synthetase